MKEPVKPTKPRKPVKPEEYIIKAKNRCYYSHAKLTPLPELVELIKERYAKKNKLFIEDVDINDVYVSYLDCSINKVSKTTDQSFSKKNKSYLKKLENYESKLKEYKDNIKKYEIEYELHKAWLVKEKEDRVKNRMKKLEKELAEIEREKKALLEG